MNIEDIRDYCLSKTNATEDTPFGEDTLVFKVGNKIYALMSITSIPTRINLKCDPEKAVELRENNPDTIIPGYHMNKKHWNTIYTDEFEVDFLKILIDNSYDLVVQSLSKKVRDGLGLM